MGRLADFCNRELRERELHDLAGDGAWGFTIPDDEMGTCQNLVPGRFAADQAAEPSGNFIEADVTRPRSSEEFTDFGEHALAKTKSRVPPPQICGADLLPRPARRRRSALNQPRVSKSVPERLFRLTDGRVGLCGVVAHQPDVKRDPSVFDCDLADEAPSAFDEPRRAAAGRHVNPLGTARGHSPGADALSKG